MKKIILVNFMAILLFAFLAEGKDCKPTELYDGYSSLGGWTIGSPYGRGPIYSVSHACKNNKCDRLYLERLVSYDENGCPHMKVIAHVVIPEVSKDETIVSGCSLNGIPDPELVATAKLTNEERFTKIVYAWRANREQNIFQTIPMKGITCANPDCGD